MSFLKDLKEWWNGLDEELEELYRQNEEAKEELRVLREGWNRQSRRHKEGFVPSQKFSNRNVKIGSAKGYSKRYI